MRININLVDLKKVVGTLATTTTIIIMLKKKQVAVVITAQKIVVEMVCLHIPRRQTLQI